MARNFSNHFVPSPEFATYKHVRSWMGAQLLQLGWMSQGCIGTSDGGPEWVFHRNGKEISTRPHLTLNFDDGSTGYWSALEPHFTGELPDWFKVQQFHAERLGARTWLFTDEFIQTEPVEFKNRTDGYHFLAHARDWDSTDVEQDLLMTVHKCEVTVADLAAELQRPAAHILAAALRLWRRRLVQVPMCDEPFGERWVVQGAPHGLR